MSIGHAGEHGGRSVPWRFLAGALEDAREHNLEGVSINA